MEAWEEHNSCMHCYDIEKLGMESPRNMYNKTFLVQNSDTFPQEYSWAPKSLYFRFSNLCNFACRMCSTYSSTWRKKLDMLLWWSEEGIKQFPQEELQKLFNKKFLEELDIIDIKWWEPFLHKQHYEFLEYLIRNNLSKNIELKYSTNLSILPGITKQWKELLPNEYKSILDIWEDFRRVTLRVSVEWYGKDNDYIRMGADWKDIEDNIHILQKVPYIGLSLTTTIQIDNLTFIPKLILFATHNNINLGISSHNFVRKPEYYNIKILPESIKKYIEKFYVIFKERNNIPSKYAQNLDDIITYMNSWKINTSLLKEYIRCTDIIDNEYSLQPSKRIYNLIIRDLKK